MKNYTALIVDGSPCCQYVNRNRHDVDLSVSVRGGKRHHCNCGWCGQRVEVDSRKGKHAGQYRYIDCDSGKTHEGLDASL